MFERIKPEKVENKSTKSHNITLFSINVQE